MDQEHPGHEGRRRQGKEEGLLWTVSPRTQILGLLARDELEQARPDLEELQVACEAVFLLAAAEL